MPESGPNACELPLLFLNIAQGGVFDYPCRVSTVLGSCVSVTLFDPRLRLGGMFHALLPEPQPDCHDPEIYRYVRSSIHSLVQFFTRAGVKPGRIEAKVFGGASNLLPGNLAVGRKNVETAFNTLSDCHIRVCASDVGGPVGRKLIFLPHTGDVFLKRLAGTLAAAAAEASRLSSKS